MVLNVKGGNTMQVGQNKFQLFFDPLKQKMGTENVTKCSEPVLTNIALALSNSEIFFH